MRVQDHETGRSDVEKNALRYGDRYKRYVRVVMFTKA